MQDQTRRFMITKLKNRFSSTYLVIAITTAAYFISVVTGYPTLSAFLAFPAVYIAPGLMLILLVSKEQNHNFRQLIVLSFFLSTVMAVAVVSILMLFGITICTFSISAVYLLLTFVSVAVAVILGKSPRINASRVDYAFLGFSLITYACLLYLFTSTPRLFTMDETTYIAWSRYAILKGETCPMGLSPDKFDLTYLVEGRFFWTMLIVSFLSSTGLEAYQAHTISAMFLPMIAITSTLLIPNKFKDNKLLQVAIFTLILTNPLLLLFSGFVLNDLAMTFYLLLAILFFIKSSNQSEQNKVSISLHGLLFSFLTLLIALFIKANVVVILAMYPILIFYILRYRLYKVAKVWKALLCALTLPLIVYEVLIDIPYVISVWFIRNEAISMLTRRFLFISPAEWFLGLFIPTPWNTTTIFSYDMYGYLHYLYRMLSPETLGLLIAGVGITLPLMLLLERFRRDIQMRILIYLTTMSLWLTYFLYLSINAFEDIPRYFIFMTPILVAISLIALYEVFSNRNTTMGIALIIPMLLLLWIRSAVSIEKGGVYISYGLPKLNWTGTILVIQLIIYISLMLLSTLGKTTIKISLKKFPKLSSNIQKLAFTVLTITVLVNATYFSAYSLHNSSFFKENEAKITSSLFSDINQNNAFVVSNFYTYMRPYVSDDLLTNGYLFPPPMTEEEFISFLEIAPNNSLLVIGHNSTIAWYEYANNYIGKYTKTDAIPPHPKIERITYDDLLLDLRLGSAIDGAVQDLSGSNYTCLLNGGTDAPGFFDKAIKFNGNDEHASVSDFEFSDTYSVEVWFMLEVEPSNFGFVNDGTPVSKMLIAKRWEGYAELTFFITNEGELQAFAKNENNDVRFNFKSPKSLVKANNWYHAILTVNNQEAELYLNGMLVSESKVKGLNQRLENYPESSREPLKIGADGTSAFTLYSYFPGRIEDIRIYNRSLTAEEVGNMYFGAKLLKENDGIKVYKIESSIQLHVSKSSLVNVTSVEVYFTNATNVKLTVTANALSDEKIFVAVGTIRFLKMLTADLKPGQNEIAWNFEHRLKDRSAYGLYIASMSRIVIYDEGGNLLYDKMHTFTLSGGYLAVWALALSLFVFFVLILNRKFHFG